MALLLNNHLLRYSNQVLCSVRKINCSIAAQTLVCQLHCFPAAVNCSPYTLSSCRKYSQTALSVKTSSVKSATASCFLLRNCRQFSSESSIPASLWKLGRLNHIAIAVSDLDKATAFYRDVLQAKVSAPQHLPTHGVTTVFVELGNTKIELLLPLGDKSPIQKFLEKNKNGGLHHVCLEVDAIEEAVAAVKSSGVRCLSPTTRIGAHGKPVMFLHPADCGGVLLELEQA